MKPIHANKKDSNEKDPKFKVGDRVRIWKHKSVFVKRYTRNWSQDFFVVSKIKNTVPWTYVISDLNSEKITGTFYENKFQKTNQQKLRIEKVIKRKRKKLYVKWKGYDNSFNSCINKKEIQWNFLIQKWVNTFLNRLKAL